MTRIMLIVFSALAALAGGASAQVTTVELIPTVRVSGDDPITLDAVARIDGPQDGLMAPLGVESVLGAADEHGWRLIEARALRTLIDDEDRIHAGSVVVRGVGVRLKRVDAAEPAETDGEDAGAAPDRTSVRDHVEHWLHDRFGATRETLRYTARDHDDAFLRLPTEGRLVEIREISRRGRVALRVAVYEHAQVVGEQALTLDVRLKRDIVTATRRIHRRDILNETVVRPETRWVPADIEPVEPGAAPGMSAARTIDPGQIVTRDLVEAPLVIERGDLVSAKSMAGGVVVSMRGRALGDARRGEIVELESESGSARFRVRAIGVGRGVVITDQTSMGGAR